MPRIFDFGGRDVERSQTVAGLRALKGSGNHAAQVTAETADERGGNGSGHEVDEHEGQHLAVLLRGRPIETGHVAAGVQRREQRIEAVMPLLPHRPIPREPLRRVVQSIPFQVAQPCRPATAP